MMATGTLYLSKQTPVGAVASDGNFVLQMLAYDRQSHRQVEAWRLLWVGAAAQTFFDVNRQHLQPGVPLEVTTRKLCVLSGAGRHAGPEIQAQVTSMYLPTVH